ncbi:MAG: TRAP transporter substrate-binding protein DctP [Hoeflea sp.]|uniref:TRAP transporter substrate-binding protein DctP n=1 Tax=Hoeflea sp. TaxID=1940281 RepID=UPI001DC2130F|nr:TRAP transporter substrate-binding protein DctP [Hoeflea sp.]MBU4527787.1 TRAP transporter substrate-binding protein DctP [Alphaproteobacteria bacterium]MBU4546178.1 TRAP transporter substrate-binding protein DctP [Alphaproteobacteria bacterium]MBU4553137.1 TRAP transporter substrate-binding protein DctP [Alphaproteobacteria bacterium]MBV1724209.1 TRAP transporter substrate-binding protein DctP [Hoeflea sp.]MBV1759894.1 TRAP transporter substrate-binding protein DctP [Hoeflea sp.]
MKITRRMILAAGMMTALTGSFGMAMAQDKVELSFSAVFSQQDIRAEMMTKFAEAVGDDIAFNGYYGGTLFKQGTELVALQRGNLDMGNIAPQDIANQLPQWSALTSAYLFRDADHLRAFFASEVGKEMTQLVEDELSVKVLGPTYFGARQVGLNLDKEIKTPADMSGIKLRMPGGEAWQFLGSALGANPVPVAYAEVYTSLQTGAIDGQDNPLPNVQNMKFYEVMKQIVLTSHLVGYDLLTISLSTWNKLSPEQQEKVQSAADAAIAWSTEQHLKGESELVAFFEKQGLKIYKPDLDAFRTFAQDKYLNSDLAKEWPEGIVDRINAIQ